MIVINRAQRQALLRVFNRCPIYVNPLNGHVTSNQSEFGETPLTYKQFRARVQPYLGYGDCVMVQWCGMWLGIESDGYTHS